VIEVFKKNKRNPVEEVESAIAKSERAINVFTSTVEQLQEANEQLDDAREKDLELINRIEDNVEYASAQIEKNSRLIGKIRDILGG